MKYAHLLLVVCCAYYTIIRYQETSNDTVHTTQEDVKGKPGLIATKVGSYAVIALSCVGSHRR